MRKKYADSNEITIKTITFKIRPPKCFKHTEKKQTHIYTFILFGLGANVYSSESCPVHWIRMFASVWSNWERAASPKILVDFVKISQLRQALNIRQVTIRGCTFNQCIQGSSYRVNHSISLMIKWPDTVGVAILYQARRIPLNR